jgi:hypothetical protein
VAAARARQVVILSATEDVRADEAGCERLHEALIWHNQATTLQHLPCIGSEPSEVLLKAATDLGADLRVMGGYSRRDRPKHGALMLPCETNDGAG